MFPMNDSVLQFGNPAQFSIDYRLLNYKELHKSGPSAVLDISDGWLTFFIGGVNPFELAAGEIDLLPRTHVSLSLSMFLEWVYFDKAYALDKGPKSFSDICAGWSSPPLRFEMAGSDVKLSWDFRESSRHDIAYANALGAAYLIPFREFLYLLYVSSESLISVITTRAVVSGNLFEWDAWLGGYQSLRQEFITYIHDFFKNCD